METLILLLPPSNQSAACGAGPAEVISSVGVLASCSRPHRDVLGVLPSNTLAAFLTIYPK